MIYDKRKIKKISFFSKYIIIDSSLDDDDDDDDSAIAIHATTGILEWKGIGMFRVYNNSNNDVIIRTTTTIN